MSNRKHLDHLAAAHAQAIVKRTKERIPSDPLSTGQSAGDVDNLVTKTLGVLQENGIYACMLYLLSRTQDKEKRIAAVVRDEVLGLLDELGFGWRKPLSSEATDILDHLTTITGDRLERLLLAKETLEQMLIYARYGAKARKAEGG